jgi:hypothetical protein
VPKELLSQWEYIANEAVSKERMISPVDLRKSDTGIPRLGTGVRPSVPRPEPSSEVVDIWLDVPELNKNV